MIFQNLFINESVREKIVKISQLDIFLDAEELTLSIFLPMRMKSSSAIGKCLKPL